VALLADGSFTLYTDIKRQQGTILAQQQLIAQNASQEVSGFFEEKYRALEATTKIVALATGSAEQKKLILESLLATQPSFRQIVLLKPHVFHWKLPSNSLSNFRKQFRTGMNRAKDTPAQFISMMLPTTP
jgi:Tfp pilus assembly protein PilN